jgi:SAM-dependent methyltransferase
MSPSCKASIKDHWDSQARKTNLPDDAVTHTDRNQRLLEIELLLRELPRGQRILDVGCGNGYSTAIICRHAEQACGVDYSAEMIERARRGYGHLGNLDFQLQDVLNLDQLPGSFDVVVSQRCLINLSNWEEQQKAIGSIAAVVRPGGLFIMQEGTRQGRERLNQLRESLGLSRMPPVAFNVDFDEDLLWPFLRRHFQVVSIRRLGLYDMISRIVHPLLVSPAEPRYDAKINEVARFVAAELEGLDHISREFSAVLRKREGSQMLSYR